MMTIKINMNNFIKSFLLVALLLSFTVIANAQKRENVKFDFTVSNIKKSASQWTGKATFTAINKNGKKIKGKGNVVIKFTDKNQKTIKEIRGTFSGKKAGKRITGTWQTTENINLTGPKVTLRGVAGFTSRGVAGFTK